MGTSRKETALATAKGITESGSLGPDIDRSRYLSSPDIRVRLLSYGTARRYKEGDKVWLKVWSLRSDKEGLFWLVSGIVIANVTDGMMIKYGEKSPVYFWLPARYFLSGNVYERSA